MEKLELLSADMIWGEKPLSVLKKYGADCVITDLALVTGCALSVSQGLSRRLGWSFTSTAGGRWTALAIDAQGERAEYYRKRHDSAIRPCFRSRELFERLSVTEDCEVTLGEYPRSAADAVVSARLDKALKNGTLLPTGKVYTFCGNTFREKKQDYRFVEKNELIFQKITTDELPDMMKSGRTFQSYGDRLRHGAEDTAVAFIPEECAEYGFMGEKFIRIKSRPKEQSEKFTLSNGMLYSPGDPVWLRVEPVEWYADFEEKLFVAKNCLVSGVRLQKQAAVPEFNFDETEMGVYLTRYMSRDIFSVSELSPGLSGEKSAKCGANPHSFDFSEVSEEDIIRGCIESGVPVFLHGASSEGKSARIRQIDPDCVVIYMRNATPDSLNGKSIVDQSSGELTDIKPTWLKKLERICESEPEKCHVLFFDELTNALPSIQGSAFNIVLDREVNGLWKLPDNAHIVAAGNELNDSLAAYQLAEPLFNRFAHVYIQTSLDAWLLWAADNRIHPAVYTYIACREGLPLRSEYDGQLPNADPRKWELASRLLYTSGRPEMLRSLVGESITADFCAFCKDSLITCEDVLGGLDPDSLSLTAEEKRNSVICLSQTDRENLEAVRSFVKAMDEEYCALFDSFWAHGELSRLETLAELRRRERENA
ncbi:MAG: hypothetical protein HUJ66_02415 [Oscillospiraceae bacterium]|nr:hypothetical protein [Oscillospiraceae bacterium]